MANDLVWDKRLLGAFKAIACLTEAEETVLNDWARGKSIVYTSMHHNMSTRTVDRLRSRIRDKYDRVQGYADLPKRARKEKKSSPDGEDFFDANVA